jgi:hypothetical protein
MKVLIIAPTFSFLIATGLFVQSANAAPRMDAAREKAIHECNVRAQKYVEHTWGDEARPGLRSSARDPSRSTNTRQKVGGQRPEAWQAWAMQNGLQPDRAALRATRLPPGVTRVGEPEQSRTVKYGRLTVPSVTRGSQGSDAHFDLCRTNC